MGITMVISDRLERTAEDEQAEGDKTKCYFQKR
jgi:hypothetical protein